MIKLNTIVESTDWESINNNAESTDSATKLFTSKYLELISKCVPEKSVTIRPKDKPWFDSELRKTIRKKNRLRLKTLKSNNSLDCDKFKRIRNKFNNMKKHAIENYHNIKLQLTDASKNNSKLYWKLLKATFKTKPILDVPPLQHTDRISFYKQGHWSRFF